MPVILPMCLSRLTCISIDGGEDDKIGIGDVGRRAESSFGHTEIDSKRVSPRSAFCRVVNLHKREELMSSRGDRNWLSDRMPVL